MTKAGKAAQKHQQKKLDIGLELGFKYWTMIISPLFSNFQVTEVQTVNVLTAHTRAVSQLALHADRKSVAVCGVSASNYGCQL